MISEVMKSNSTLTSLNLGGEEEKAKRRKKIDRNINRKEKQERNIM